MKKEAEFIAGGGVTTPRGFLAGAVKAGIKYADRRRLDLGILFSESDCTAAALFTTNQVKAAPVLLDIQRLRKGTARAVVMNSGSANACTGQQGMADAIETAALAARHTGVKPEETLAASTGVIGVTLPMERIRAAIPKIVVTRAGGHDLALAIMTTDTAPKEGAVEADGFTIGGILKGAGMIHPDLATMLCFLTTDARVEAAFLKRALRQAADISFNMMSVDNDNSTNDTALIMANGAAGGETIKLGGRRAEAFQQALNKLCVYLARECARDGEGATKLIEVKVSGAASLKDARLAARTIAGSMLVKAAVHGSDPNWGRALAAAGRSGAQVTPEKTELYIGETRVVKGGEPVPFDKEAAVRHLDGKEVAITLDLHIGRGVAIAWGCDLSEEYVKINAEYTT
jgi:glutamate N-acetyltransferase / amino-acid N-acetyltransferase